MCSVRNVDRVVRRDDFEPPTTRLELGPERASLRHEVVHLGGVVPHRRRQIRAVGRLREVLRHRDALMTLRLQLPAGPLLSYAGLREFGPIEPLWEAGADGAL